MSSDHQSTEMETLSLLEVLADLKHKCFWSKGGLTKDGWRHLYKDFEAKNGAPLPRKVIQNKYNGLKNKYRDFRKFVNHTGLGRSITGSITADPEFWETSDLTGATGRRGRGEPPKYLAQLNDLFGDSQEETGNLLYAGGVRPHSPSDGSEQTPPPTIASDNTWVGCSAAVCLGKRPMMDRVDESLAKKRSSGLAASFEALSDSIRSKLEEDDPVKAEQAQVKLCMQMVKADGIPEGTELYNKAIYLFKNSCNRAGFMGMETAAGQRSFLE